MILKFMGKIHETPNCKGIWINTISIHKKNGEEIVLDRKWTEWEVKDGNYSMEWYRPYIWNGEIENFDIPEDILDDVSHITIDVEEDADAEYKITIEQLRMNITRKKEWLKDVVLTNLAMPKKRFCSAKRRKNMRTYTWNELYKAAEGAGCGEFSLKVKDNARGEVREFVLEKAGHDLDKDEIPEETVEAYCNKYNLQFNENGNIVTLLKPNQHSKTNVVIVVEDGMVIEVLCRNKNVQVEVIDLDTTDSEELKEKDKRIEALHKCKSYKNIY